MTKGARIPTTVPFVRTVLDVAGPDRSAASDSDTRIDDAAMHLVALMRRHGVDVVARKNGYPALDNGSAFDRTAPFLAETWLIFPAEWTMFIDVVVDGMTAWPSHSRWATLVADFAAAHSDALAHTTFLDYDSVADVGAVVDDYNTFIRSARRVVEHAWRIGASAAPAPAETTIGAGAIVTLRGPTGERVNPEVRVGDPVRNYVYVGAGYNYVPVCSIERALVGRRRGDVVDTSYGAMKIIAVRWATT